MVENIPFIYYYSMSMLYSYAAANVMHILGNIFVFCLLIRVHDDGILVGGGGVYFSMFVCTVYICYIQLNWLSYYEMRIKHK